MSMAEETTRSPEAASGKPGMPIRERAASNTIFVLLAQVFGRIATIVMLGYLARRFSASGLGAYNLVVAFTGVFGLVADLGLQAFLSREIAASPQDSRRLLRYGAIASLVSGLIAFVACNGIAQIAGYDGRLKEWILIASLANFAGPAVLPLAWLNARLEGRAVAWLTISKYVLGSAAVIFVVLARRDIKTLIVLQLLATVLYGALVVVRTRALRVYSSRWSWMEVRSGIRTTVRAAPLGVLAVGGIMIAYFDTFLLSLVGTKTAIGYYSAGYRLIGALDIIPAAVGTTVLPLVAARTAAGTEVTARAIAAAYRYTVLVGLPVVAGTFILAKPLIEAIYGSGLRPSAAVVRVLSPEEFSFFFGPVAATALIALRRTRALFITQAITLPLNAGACLLFVPHFSYLAAAWISTCTELLGTACMLMMLARYQGGVRAILPLGASRKAVVACIAMCCLTVLLERIGVPLPVNIAGSAVVYALALAAIRELGREDLTLVASVLRRGARPVEPGV